MFAFSQIQPETTGNVSDMEVPLSKYLSASFTSGWGGTLGKIYDISRMEIEKEDESFPILSAEKANELYPSSFTHVDPVRENVANLIQEKHQRQNELSYFLANDNHNILSAGLGMSVSMLASTLNPVDLTLMFLPVVGAETKLVEGANILGRGRHAFAEGFITRQALAKAIPSMPRLAESVIQGASFMSIAEVPHQIAALEYKEDPGNPLLNIASGTAFAAGMHLTLSALGQIWSRLSTETKIAMYKKAADDFVKGEDIAVDHLAKVDKSYAEEQVALQEQLTELEFNKINALPDDVVNLPEKTFAEKIHEIFKSRLDALRKELVPFVKGEKPVIPETGVNVGQEFTSVLDEVRKKNLRTKEQIQLNFPQAMLTREEAAVIRKAAWHEKEVKAQQTQNLQDLIDKVKNTLYQKEQGVKRKARLEAERNMPNPISAAELKEQVHDPVNPTDATIGKVEEQAKQIEDFTFGGKDRAIKEQLERLQELAKQNIEANKPTPEAIKTAADCIIKTIL